MTSGAAFGVHVAGAGNVFMREIADLVVTALHDLGREAELVVDQLPVVTPGRIDLVVAPHELFTLVDADPLQRRAAARGAICIGVEQPGTPWFEISAAFAAAGPMALDINALAVAELRRRRITVDHLPLGYHESWDRAAHEADGALRGLGAEDRPVDLLFLGAATPHREAWIAEHADLLSAYECDLRLFEFDRPVQVGQPGFLSGAAKHARLAQAKVLLNVHRGDVPYFEWVRALEAIANGCVFLTEASSGTEPLRAYEHFVPAAPGTLGGYAAALLADDAWRCSVAADAHRFVRERLHFSDLLDRVLPDVEAAAARARGPRRIDVRAVVRNRARQLAVQSRQVGGVVRAAVGARLRGNVVGELHDAHADLRQQLKGLTLSNRRLQRQLEAMQAKERFGDPDHVGVTTNAAYADAMPDITVVLPLYNYAHLVGDAIDSVVAAQGVRVELVVVDDHSSDASLAVATAKLEEHDWFPMAVAAKATNAGLSAARNTGFDLARGDKVFLLDADNTIYPHCLRLLAAALDAGDDDVAFAYGIVARHGDESSLISHLPWDVARLCEGNYIDAMAMVRQSAWKAVGGYDPSIDERYGGWEDYEMWLHLAAAGFRGELVPQVVARYWKHTGSMLSLLNLETASVRVELRARYPDLAWPDEPVGAALLA